MSWHVSEDEAAMIDEIIEDISSRLPFTQPLDFSNFVGMTDHMKRISPLLQIDSVNVRMIGIWGMGGIGKTTIAKYLYEQHKRKFSPYYCFMENVAKLTGERGLLYLQEQLLCNIFRQKNMKLESVEQGRQQLEFTLRHLKVFLVLDDVDDVSQLDALAENTTWFGRGSKIIITTRDKGLLKACRVDNVHEVKCLDYGQSLQMFKENAFRGGSPPSDGHEQLSVRASRLVQGLPSAIKAFSSYLSGKTTIEEWESSLNRLKRKPPQNIMTILQLSYNGLEEPDKNVFLHIVFLFIGSTVHRVTTLLDDDELETKLGITNLVDKSLISLSTDGCISMHVLIEQMGREVALLESQPKRRFLRDPQEISKVLSQGRGTHHIQCITFHMCEISKHPPIGQNALDSMPSLKFLKFYKHLDDKIFNLPAGSVENVFPDELRLLHWDAYFSALPSEPLIFSFQGQSLVEVNLRYNNLEHLGEIQGFENLRRLDLTGSRYLREISSLSTAKKLEELIISGCPGLNTIPESTCSLPCLRKLSVGHLSGTAMITDLQKGSLSRCCQIRMMLPNADASLDYLTDLTIESDILIDLLGLKGNADGLSFSPNPQTRDQLILTMGLKRATPQVISEVHSCKSLNIKRSKYVAYGDSFRCYSFSKFLCLTELSLTNLNIQEVPSDIGDLQSLEKQDLSGNDFALLPVTMGQQAKLKYMILCNCRKLKRLPQLAQVERLTLSDCVSLRSLMEGVPGVEKDLRSYHLLELCLDNCNNVESVSYELGHFSNLTYLDLSSHDFGTLPSNIKDLSSLVTLCLNNCKNLIFIEKLPLSLQYLFAHGCHFLLNVSLSSIHSIKHLDFSQCFSLVQIEKLMTGFLKNQHIEAISPRFACLPASKDSTFFNNRLPMIKGTNVWVAVASRIQLQFPSGSYTWNWGKHGKIYITLRPDFGRPLETNEDDVGTSYQLVFINIPSMVTNEDASILRLEARLDFPEELKNLNVPPAQIVSSGCRFVPGWY